MGTLEYFYKLLESELHSRRRWLGYTETYFNHMHRGRLGLGDPNNFTGMLFEAIVSGSIDSIAVLYRWITTEEYLIGSGIPTKNYKFIPNLHWKGVTIYHSPNGTHAHSQIDRLIKVGDIPLVIESKTSGRDFTKKVIAHHNRVRQAVEQLFDQEPAYLAVLLKASEGARMTLTNAGLSVIKFEDPHYVEEFVGQIHPAYRAGIPKNHSQKSILLNKYLPLDGL